MAGDDDDELEVCHSFFRASVLLFPADSLAAYAIHPNLDMTLLDLSAVYDSSYLM